MMLGQRDLRAKASMQCLSGLVNGPYFILFSCIGFNFKVLILGRLGVASHLLMREKIDVSERFLNICNRITDVPKKSPGETCSPHA